MSESLSPPDTASRAWMQPFKTVRLGDNPSGLLMMGTNLLGACAERLLRRSARSHGSQTCPDQRIHLIPDRRITFDLCVWLHEDAIVPGILGTSEPAFLIVGFKVSNDSRA
jgi:hypothetical protein